MHPVSTSEAREALSRTVHRFREEGHAAEPLIFGSHRKPEAVVLPYGLYEEMRELIEELRTLRTLRERDAADSGRRRSLDDVASRFGIDLDSL